MRVAHRMQEVCTDVKLICCNVTGNAQSSDSVYVPAKPYCGGDSGHQCKYHVSFTFAEFVLMVNMQSF